MGCPESCKKRDIICIILRCENSHYSSFLLEVLQRLGSGNLHLSHGEAAADAHALASWNLEL